MKILITGSNGQLGSQIKKIAPKFVGKEPIQLIISNREELDFLNPKGVYLFIKKINPCWVINAAAFTNVENAEEEKMKAMIINRDSPGALAEALLETGGKLVHISTDFVFDGGSTSPYKTCDKTNPINFYGKSKEAGEKKLLEQLSQNNQLHIVRTSWLMGSVGRNFALTLLKLHQTKKEIKVIYDQIGSPTSTNSLANFCWKIILNSKYSQKIPSLLHWCDSGVASWYDVAVAVGEIGTKLELLKSSASIVPILTSQYPSKAKRPNFSVLDCQLSEEIFNTKRLHWRHSLELMLKDTCN